MAIKYPKVERGTSVPPFQLTKSMKITVERALPGDFDENGRWQEGTRFSMIVDANVQPAKGYDLMIVKESDRSEEWIKIYTREELFTLYEGLNGREADVVIYDGKRYQVKNAKPYKMGVLNHTRALAVRLPVINGGADG